MPYRIFIKRSAEKELDRLPASIRERIVGRVVNLEDHPRPPGSKKLQGEESYRLRIGNYRVLYTIDNEQHLITIYAVGHRREVYR